MRSILATVVAVILSLGVVSPVDAVASNCDSAHSRSQAISICTSGYGSHRVWATARNVWGNHIHVHGPWRGVGRGSVVNAPSGYWLISDWYQVA